LKRGFEKDCWDRKTWRNWKWREKERKRENMKNGGKQAQLFSNEGKVEFPPGGEIDRGRHVRLVEGGRDEKSRKRVPCWIIRERTLKG